MGEIADKHLEKRIARKLETCRHFTGIQHDTCAAGVAYRSVRDTSGPGMARWPCTGECSIACEKKELRTRQEAEAEVQEFERRWAAMGPARAAIIATKLPSGSVDCPLCSTRGGLRFRVSSYNGHVHAACSTKECLSWME